MQRSSKRWLLAAEVLAVLLAATSALALDARRKTELLDLVRQDCGSCHGMTMKGGLGRPLLPAQIGQVPSESLAAIILDGVPGTPMPPWRGLLTPAEARWIADRLKEGLPP